MRQRHVFCVLGFLISLLPTVGRGQSVYGAPVSTSAPVTFPYRDVAVGDIDGDCFDDLIIVRGSLFAGSFAVMRNDGAGSLMMPTYPGSEVTPAAAEIIDANQDGLGDVIATSLIGQILAFPSLGGGALDLSCPTWGAIAPAPSVLYILEKADLDGDGDEDFVAGPMVGPGGSGDVRAFLNSGNGTFAPAGVTSIGAVPAGNLLIRLADLNGDGLADMISRDQSGQITVHFNMGAGTFGAGVTLPAPALAFTDVEPADTDADGDCDILATSSPAGTLYRFVNDGTGNFIGPFVFIPMQTIFWVRAADLDGDGDVDLITSPTPFFPGGPVDVRHHGSYSSATTVLMSGMEPIPVDLDRDGLPDILSMGVNEVWVVPNQTAAGMSGGGSGLASSVNGGPFDATPKAVTGGDMLSYGFDAGSLPACALGNMATLFVNIPPDSAQVGVTALPGGATFPGLDLVWPFSTPSGTCFLTGDSLGWMGPGIVDLGFPPVLAGDPPLTLMLPPAVSAVWSGALIRIQGMYLDPSPATFATFGLVATITVEFMVL